MTGGNEDRVRASSPWRRMVLISPSWWPPLSPAVMAAETVARAVGPVQVVAVAAVAAEETLDVAAAAAVETAETAGEAVVFAECANFEVLEVWSHPSGEAWQTRKPLTSGFNVGGRFPVQVAFMADTTTQATVPAD